MQRQKPLPRYRPASKPPVMVLTKRDREVLATLYRYRALTTLQIQKLLFPTQKGENQETKLVVCRRRLRKLYHNRFIERLKVPVLSGTGSRPDVYALKRLGVNVVAEDLQLDHKEMDWKPRENKISPVVLDHLLDVNDVRAAVELETRDINLVLHEWLDERELKRRQRRVKAPRMALKKIPDGYFVIHTPKTRACFFLEVDRGTEAGASKIAGKIKAYQNYYFTGQYTRDFGTRSLRVLFILDKESRLKNISRLARQVQHCEIFWFSLAEVAKKENIFMSDIWIRGENNEASSLFSDI